MSNIIQFPKQKPKIYTLPSSMFDEVETIQAVNELTCELLCEVLPVFIERGWSLAELDGVVADFTMLMIQNAPPVIIRHDLDDLKLRLRPIWHELVASIHRPIQDS